jgi:DNA replication licensing factor MCM4
VIWGTNINQNDVQSRMKNFINSYTIMDNDEDFNSKPIYLQALQQCSETEEYILNIDCNHIWEYDQILYRQLENYPSDVIPMFDLVASQCFKEQCLMAVDKKKEIMASGTERP